MHSFSRHWRSCKYIKCKIDYYWQIKYSDFYLNMLSYILSSALLEETHTDGTSNDKRSLYGFSITWKSLLYPFVESKILVLFSVSSGSRKLIILVQYLICRSVSSRVSVDRSKEQSMTIEWNTTWNTFWCYYAN